MPIRRTTFFLLGSVFGLVIIAIFAPLLAHSGISFPLCELPKVSAQDNPCLDREVTISAQEVQILRLQATMNVQEIANLQLQTRNRALEATINAFEQSPLNQIVITVPVLVTATPIFNPTRATSQLNVSSAEVEIVRVLSPGEINSEGIDIQNNGVVIDLSGWEISNSSGETYTFPQQRVFTGGVITLYTRVGSDTPQAKFWGLDTAVWFSGDTVTLIDTNGSVQSVYEIP